MKFKRVAALFLTSAMTVGLVSGCGGGKAAEKPAGDAPKAEAPAGDAAKDAPKEEAPADAATSDAGTAGAPAEGKDTNNGRPYNLTPVKYDTRADKYLYGINATVLPITPEVTTIDVWRGFSSTVMKSQSDSEALKEMEKRTNIKINWLNPPVGSETDNFNLRISSNDLPHIFSCPPLDYPGGYAKAVADEVYIPMTEYYDKGWMPNIKYLRENHEDINRDIVDDNGGMNFLPMMDMIPSDPWSGMWIRQDWLDELGMQKPTTIDEWEKVLYAMKDLKKVAPLALKMQKLDGWYGVFENYAFVGSYEASFRNFINKDGKVVFGSTEPGYKDFLTLMAKWYKDGILDPDFATRTNEDYNSQVASGKIGACGLAYGEFGQAKLSGQKNDPKFNLVPVLQPTSYQGQTIHLHQDNTTVRSGSGDREFLTVRILDDKLEETIMKYKDYWYSQDGGDLLSYGPEGVSYKWLENGEYEWIYPKLVEDKDSDFWTLYPLFKVHNFGYLRNSASYEFEPEVKECIELWGTQDASWIMPDNISFTADEAKELATIMTDIETLKEETTLKIVTGQAPVGDWDKYVEKVQQMNLKAALDINQAALDRYNAR